MHSFIWRPKCPTYEFSCLNRLVNQFSPTEMQNKNIPNSIANYAFIINNCCLIASRTGSLSQTQFAHHPVITINFQPQGQWTRFGFWHMGHLCAFVFRVSPGRILPARTLLIPSGCR